MLITTNQWKAMRLLLNQLGIAVFALLLIIAAAGTSTAQSTDRDKPTPLKSN